MLRILILIAIINCYFLVNTSYATKNKDVSARVEALVKQGAKFGLEKSYDDAIVFFEEALELDPKNPDIYFKLAYVYEESGNLRKAIDLYEKALEFDKKNSEIYYNLGNVYFALGLISKAEEQYRTAIKYNKKDEVAWYNLSVMEYINGNFDKAIEYADKSEELGQMLPEEYEKALDKHR